MFFLMTHSTHFLFGFGYGKGPLGERRNLLQLFMDNYFQLAARGLLYASSYREDST